MQNADVGWTAERLINDTISFRQTEQCSELFLGRVSLQIEVQSNLLEPDRDVLGNTERAAKIKIALRLNRRAAQLDAQCRSNCAQRNACTANQRFQQHVGRACALAVASGRRVKPCFDPPFSGFYLAGDPFSNSPFCPERECCCCRALSILSFKRCLQCSQFVSIHSFQSLPSNCRGIHCSERPEI